MTFRAKKSYGQYCGLAKALDHVGDRWTLLIVRELLISPRRYSEIREALPGIATNLLADRLRDLEADGIIRSGSYGAYELTDFGRGLEKAVHELVRWGGHWMGDRTEDEEFRPEWLAVALAALLPRRRKGKVEIRADGAVVNIDRGRVDVGPADDPEAVVEGSADAILGLAAGRAPFSGVSVIKGDRRVAAAVLTGVAPKR
ncbi:MAG: helix-turn-helix transcriptional regulator [Actinomycetota bacterium]|nr:helix-turn-helix transcriptional regulator [Actinomycetota bacterium]